MKQFVNNLKLQWPHRPFVLGEFDSVSATRLDLPTCGTVLVLAPHPDDPECVSITLRILMEAGCDIRYAILSMGSDGVADDYALKFKKNNSFQNCRSFVDFIRDVGLRREKNAGLCMDKTRPSPPGRGGPLFS